MTDAVIDWANEGDRDGDGEGSPDGLKVDGDKGKEKLGDGNIDRIGLWIVAEGDDDGVTDGTALCVMNREILGLNDRGEGVDDNDWLIDGDPVCELVGV